MVSVIELWLPILVGAVIVFFGSAIIWMATPLHTPDIKPAPEGLEKAVAELKMERGHYLFPMGGNGPKDMKDRAFMERFDRGPWGSITISGKPNFGLNLARTFAVYLVTLVFVAYVTGQALGPGAAYFDVFRVAGAAAVLGFTFGGLPNDVFFAKPTRFVISGIIEAAILATLAAGAFAGLWPEGAPIPTP